MDGRLKVGDRIYVDEGDSLGATEYSGTVTESRDDGTYTVLTRDGKRKNLDPEFVADVEILGRGA